MTDSVYEKYSEYIMTNGDIPICNSDMLVTAMESGYLWEDFCADNNIPEDSSW